MKSDVPKQYLHIGDQCILEHTVNRLLANTHISRIIVAISRQDTLFGQLSIHDNTNVTAVEGGASRAESVIKALEYMKKQDHGDFENSWALVHDAARPCVRSNDIDSLISQCINSAPVDEKISESAGGILAVPVRDTMKRAVAQATCASNTPLKPHTRIQSTVDRENLWHALTPQMFKCKALLGAYKKALLDKANITDEASAMEHLGCSVDLVESHPGNIKITHPDDLELAAFYLQRGS